MLTVGVANDIRGNYIQGGLSSISATTGATNIVDNISDSPASDAISLTANVASMVHGNTVYNPGGNGIVLAATLTADVSIISNLFHTITVSSKYPVSYEAA